MKHWYRQNEDSITMINKEEKEDDFFNDCRVLQIKFLGNTVLFEEECDNCFSIETSVKDAIITLHEAIEWLYMMEDNYERNNDS